MAAGWRVTIKLSKRAGDRLNAMCHARGMRASQLIEQWIAEHNEMGQPKRLWQRVVDAVDELLDV